MAQDTTARSKLSSYNRAFVWLVLVVAAEVATSYALQGAARTAVLLTLLVVNAGSLVSFFMDLRGGHRLWRWIFIVGVVVNTPIILIMLIVMPHF
jgi:cytochrome c oxidase subunit IV